jgi:beta-galactosidase/beta-glucuronidase
LAKIDIRSKKHQFYFIKMKKILSLGILSIVVCGLIFFASVEAARPRVYVKKLKESRYQLIVEGKPFIIKGVCYNPIPIGQDYSYAFPTDPNQPWLVDGKLMQEAGINTVRFYKCEKNCPLTKKLINGLYQKFGIHTIMGHWLGFWDYPGPFYADKDFQEKIKKEVLEMVSFYKDEPGILFWVLGNENNYSFTGAVQPWSSDAIDKEPDPQKQALMRGKAYYSFVNELAKEIKKIDPNHPVALGNGELRWLDIANEACPDIDIVASIIYRGKTFGNLFNSLKATFNRPLVLIEFGADAYDAYLNKEDQNMQAFFLESQWRQIYENLADNSEGAGNCLGGTIFEWTDEWWKHNECDQASWSVHDTGAGWSNGSYYFDIKARDNKNMNEEWFGIVALSEELENGVNKRIPRKAYYVLREFWKNPVLGKKDKK